MQITQKRINEIKRKHINAYNWIPGEIPFGIWVNDRSKHKKINYGMTDLYKLFFERQMTILGDTIAVGSDIIPVFGIKNFGVGIVPSIFGAALKPSNTDVYKIEDTGYWVENIFKSMDDIWRLNVPILESDLLTEVIQQLAYYKENSPSWAEKSVMMSGPFSIAELLRGSQLYIDIYDNPQYVHRLMEISTEVTIGCMKLILKVLGYGDTVKEYCTPMGMWYPGLRFGDDSIINLSPEMIKEFVVPYYDKMSESFDCQIEVHFCSTPKLMGEHVIQGFNDSVSIKGISTQLGIIHYKNMLESLKYKLSVEAGYGDAIAYFSEKYGSFKNWASEIKRQYSGISGLVLYTEVGSVEEGKRLLDDWMTA